MMIIMQPGASQEQIQAVIAEIEKQQLTSHPIFGVEQTIIGAVGDGHYVAKEIFEALPGVMEVQRISKPYKLASRQFHEQDSVFPLDGFTIGGTEIPIIAGPCSVESREQILEVAQAVKEAGAMRYEEACSSRARRPIPSRVLARRDSNTWRKRVRKQDCPSLSK